MPLGPQTVVTPEAPARDFEKGEDAFLMEDFLTMGAGNDPVPLFDLVNAYLAVLVGRYQAELMLL